MSLAVKRHANDKAHLPQKVCTVCARPFVWRKKWAQAWDEVKYCSEACRKQRNKGSAHA
ncbi:MAG TPA: DUF2256 domain-containing protein [bacterium]|nr:DUF2256 domain-containing protein [bacterium]